MSLILRHQGVKLIFAYSWARSAILAAGKGRRGMLLFLLFLHFHSFSFLSCHFLFSPVPLFHLLHYLFYLSSPFLRERHKMTHKGWRVVKPKHKQKPGHSISFKIAGVLSKDSDQLAEAQADQSLRRPHMLLVGNVVCGSSLYTVEPRYLELAYFELPLISKWNSCFNMKLWQQVTK